MDQITKSQNTKSSTYEKKTDVEKNKKRYTDALEQAKKNDPQNDFVKSCDIFFNKTGFLTPKQLSAIEKIKPRKEKNDFTNSKYRKTTGGYPGAFSSEYPYSSHSDRESIEQYNYDNWDMSPGEKG